MDIGASGNRSVGRGPSCNIANVRSRELIKAGFLYAVAFISLLRLDRPDSYSERRVCQLLRYEVRFFTLAPRLNPDLSANLIKVR